MGGAGSRWAPLLSDPFPSPSEGGIASLSAPSCTHYLLPHGRFGLLTFSMTPITLQPLSCSRAELSVRMGRSLRLLKPCRGGRQAAQPQGPACLSPCFSPGRGDLQQPGSTGSGQEQGTVHPHLTGAG